MSSPFNCVSLLIHRDLDSRPRKSRKRWEAEGRLQGLFYPCLGFGICHNNVRCSILDKNGDCTWWISTAKCFSPAWCWCLCRSIFTISLFEHPSLDPCISSDFRSDTGRSNNFVFGICFRFYRERDTGELGGEVRLVLFCGTECIYINLYIHDVSVLRRIRVKKKTHVGKLDPALENFANEENCGFFSLTI